MYFMSDDDGYNGEKKMEIEIVLRAAILNRVVRDFNEKTAFKQRSGESEGVSQVVI